MKIQKILTGKVAAAVVLLTALVCWGCGDNQSLHGRTLSSAAQPQSSAGIQIEMIKIPGGTFMMGSESSEASRFEKPVHQVTVDSFFMGKTEVTRGQWNSVMGGANPSKIIGDDLPVELVSWNADAAG